MKTKFYTRRGISLLLTLLMLLTLLPAVPAVAADTVDVTISLVKSGEGFYVMPQEFEVSANLSDTYGYGDLDNGVSLLDAMIKVITVLHGTDKAAVNAQLEASGDSVSDFMGNGRNVTGLRNGEFGEVGFNQTPIVDGDKVEICLLADDYGADAYAWFEYEGERTEKVTVIKGEPFELAVRGSSWMLDFDNWPPEPQELYDADIVLVNVTNEGGYKTGTLETTLATTDESGKATITFSKTGTYILSLDGEPTDMALPVTPAFLEVTVTDAAPHDPAEAMAKTAKYLLESNYEYGISEWVVFGLARAGLITGDFKAQYLEKLVLPDIDTPYIQPTEFERVALALTSLGIDATNYKGENLLEPLADFDFINSQTINALIFGLLAFDSNAYEIPVLTGGGTQTTRDGLIGGILDKQLTDGGWALFGSSSDPDVTAMAIQSLAPYCGTNLTVENAVDKALTCLSLLQKDSGGFESWYALNSQSSAQVMIALNALGISLDDSRFVKNGNTVFDALMAHSLESGAFNHTLEYPDENSMSTEQAMYALASLNRALTPGANTLYNMTDAFPAEPVEPTYITVKIRVEGNSENLFYGNVTVPAGSGGISVLDVMKHFDAVNNSITMTGLDDGYISEINGETAASFGGFDGWMYLVNGVSPDVGMSDYTVKANDSIVLYYGDFSLTLNPIIDTSALNSSGKITFTANTYDTDWNPITVPVSDATVTWYNGQASEKYTTDANGSVTIPAAQRTNGAHRMQIEKYDTSGLALVIRLASDYTVTVSGQTGGGGGGSTGDITVTFTLLGDSAHGSGGGTHTLAGNNLTTWISKTSVTVPAGSSVGDVFKKVLDSKSYTYVGLDKNYISSITTPQGVTLAEFTNGQNSGWMYTVNGTHPQYGLNEWIVKNGDDIVWHYTDDYTKEESSGDWGGGGSGGGGGGGGGGSGGDTGGSSGSSSAITATPVISGGSATVAVTDSQLTKALDNAGTSGEVRVTADTKDATNALVSMSGKSLKAAAGKSNVVLTIETGVGTLTFDSTSLAKITSGVSDSAKIELTMSGTVTLSEANKSIVGDSPAFELKILADGKSVTDFGTGKVTAALPFTVKSGENTDKLTVYHLADDGTVTQMSGARYDKAKNAFVFETSHFSVFFIAEKPADSWTNPFSDVKESDWFYEAVKYANINSLMSGMSADKFEPNANLTRAMLITILARESGVDTNGGEEWYSKAVDWGMEKGITDGTDLGGDITREQLATMLYRYAGLGDGWGGPALEWAQKQGIMNDGRAGDTATRAEVATMLMRFLENM